MPKIRLFTLLTISLLLLSACGGGGTATSFSVSPVPTPSPSPSPTPFVIEESGVSLLDGTPSVVNPGFIFSTAPSKNIWNHYQSGTTGAISKVFANPTYTLALHTANSTVESAGFILGTNLTQQYINTTSAMAESIANLSIPHISGDDNGFVVAGTSSSATKLYYISNNGSISSVSSYLNTSAQATPISSITFSTLAHLNGQFYLYSNSLILTSSDGINWSELNSPTLVTGLSNVVEVTSGVYAGLASGGQIYLGATPSSLSTATGATADVITASNGYLYSATYDNMTMIAHGFIYAPTASSLGVATDQLTIDFSSYGLLGVVRLDSIAVVNNNVYTAASSHLFGVAIGSAIVATAPSTNTSVVAAIGGTSTPAYSMTMITQDNKLLIANSPAGIQGKVINNVSSPSTSHNGNLTILDSIDYSNSIVHYTNLPSGKVNVEIEGFAGNPVNYMFVLADGATLVSTGSRPVPGATILNQSSGVPSPDTIIGITSSNNTYLVNAQLTNAAAPGSGSLYFSERSGQAWTQITLTSMPVASSQSTLLGASTSSFAGLYYITTTDGVNNATYQTATPANLATWVQSSGLPIQASSSYMNGVLYSFTSASTTVGEWDPLSQQFNPLTNAIPQSYYEQNVAWNGSIFAQAQSASTNFWTGESIVTDGASTFNSNTAVFSGINNVTLNDIFTGFPILLWTDKVWIVVGGSSNVYTSPDGITWSAAVFESAYVQGAVPTLF